MPLMKFAATLLCSGPTLVMDQHFDTEEWAAVPEVSRRAILVYPAHNQMLVFDGGLAHGVMDSNNKVIRKTLLVNW